MTPNIHLSIKRIVKVIRKIVLIHDYYDILADASTTPSSALSSTTLSSTTPSSSVENCPTRGAWQNYGQWCFLFMPNDYVDWHSARQRCQLAATNSTLVSVHDYDEQHFVHTSMEDASLIQAAGYHIGLYLGEGGTY